MFYLRLPILTFIALALALWLKAGNGEAQARGRAPNSEEAKASEAASVAGITTPIAAPATAASATPAAAAPAALDLRSVAPTNPYEKLAKVVAAKAGAVNWTELRSALLELNISIPPVSSALSTQMWKLSQAPEADKRLAWVKSTDHVVTINRYVEESHGSDDSSFRKANRSLRSGGALDADQQKYVSTLQAALRKLPPVQGFSFRGAVLGEDQLKTYAEGSSVTEKAFTSASLNPATAYGFAFPKEAGFFRSVKPLAEGETRVLFIIQGHGARPVSYFSDYWAEAEILFDHGTDFTVRAVSPRQDDGSRYVILEEK